MMMMMRLWREAAAAAATTARTDADAGGALPAEVDDFRGSVAQAAYPPAPRSLPPSLCPPLFSQSAPPSTLEL